jgi:hypothetical protein
MGGTCSTGGRSKKFIQNFSPKILREKSDYLGDLFVDERITLNG